MKYVKSNKSNTVCDVTRAATILKAVVDICIYILFIYVVPATRRNYGLSDGIPKRAPQERAGAPDAQLFGKAGKKQGSKEWTKARENRETRLSEQEKRNQPGGQKTQEPMEPPKALPQRE